MVSLLVAQAAACSEKSSKPAAPAGDARPAGPPPACVELEALLAKLAACVPIEDMRHVDILMAKSQLQADLSGRYDPAQVGARCGEVTKRFRAAFEHCLSAEAIAESPAPPPSSTIDAGPGSAQTAPAESVPLDRKALGKLPRPFGTLAFLRAGITAKEILATLPYAKPVDAHKIKVPLGIEVLEAQIDIDFAGTLDVIKINTPRGTRDLLVAAWGTPARGNTWFDRVGRWRADMSGDELMIGPYVPFEELIGAGPDGLADPEPLIGMPKAALAKKYGARWNGTEILMPATDYCAYYTHLYVDIERDRVARLRLEQCFDDEERRRAIIAAMDRRYGKATAVRTPDDRAVLAYSLPGRILELTLGSRWELTIKPGLER